MSTKLTWLAKYDDGSVLWGSDATSSEQIDRTKLISFSLIAPDLREVYIRYFQEGQSLIYRRRTQVVADGKQDKKVVHLVGWRKKIGSMAVGSMTAIFESDLHTEEVTDFVPGHPWLCEIQPVPADDLIIGHV